MCTHGIHFNARLLFIYLIPRQGTRKVRLWFAEQLTLLAKHVSSSFCRVYELLCVHPFLLTDCCCSIPEPHDCQDIRDKGLNGSGLYHVTPLGSYEGFDVYCDMDTGEGGWLVRAMAYTSYLCYSYRPGENYTLYFANFCLPISKIKNQYITLYTFR